jgi:hypothetical protein
MIRSMRATGGPALARSGIKYGFIQLPAGTDDSAGGAETRMSGDEDEDEIEDEEDEDDEEDMGSAPNKKGKAAVNEGRRRRRTRSKSWSRRACSRKQCRKSSDSTCKLSGTGELRAEGIRTDDGKDVRAGDDADGDWPRDEENGLVMREDENTAEGAIHEEEGEENEEAGEKEDRLDATVADEKGDPSRCSCCLQNSSSSYKTRVSKRGLVSRKYSRSSAARASEEAYPCCLSIWKSGWVF